MGLQENRHVAHPVTGTRVCSPYENTVMVGVRTGGGFTSGIK